MSDSPQLPKKKLMRSDFSKKIRHGSNSGISLFNGFDLKRNGDHEIEFDFDVFLPTKHMNLQRGLVWTLEQKRQFIWSILKGQHIPKIVVITRRNYDFSKKPSYQVIDGKQRINAFISFICGEFALIHNGVEYFYDDLSDLVMMEINTYSFKADEYYEYPDELFTDDEKIYLFEMVNFFGTPMDIEHINNLKS